MLSNEAKAQMQSQILINHQFANMLRQASMEEQAQWHERLAETWLQAMEVAQK